jgi:hypothetical protein
MGTMRNFKGGKMRKPPRMAEAFNVRIVHRGGAEDTESRVFD